MDRSIAIPAALAAAALLTEAAGGTPPPPPPPEHHYYGPLRICDPATTPFYAVDILPGEAVTVQADDIRVQKEDGGFIIGWIPGPGFMIGGAIEPLGEVPVPNAGTVQRVRVQDRIRYRIDTQNNLYSGWVEIGSSDFDGSDRDLVTLKRIRFGPDARSACAAIPEPLAATPEKRSDLANWLSPRRHPGPFTLCLDYLAFDVRAGETAMLPWYDFAMARVDTGSRKIAINSGLHPLGSPSAWPVSAVALVDDPRFTAITSTESTIGNMLLAPAIEVRIMTRADHGRFGPRGGGSVTFSFASDPGEPERLAFARRLRWKTPGDRCYKAGRAA